MAESSGAHARLWLLPWRPRQSTQTETWLLSPLLNGLIFVNMEYLQREI